MNQSTFQLLLGRLTESDMRVVTKLDRFAHTTIQCLKTVCDLFQRGMKLYILNTGLVENILKGNLILTVMLAFAEYQR